MNVVIKNSPEHKSEQSSLNTQSVNLFGLTCVSPQYTIKQSEARDLAEKVFGPLPPHLKQVFDNAGIDTRQSCVPPSWYLQNHDWAEKNDQYLTSADELLTELVKKVLARTALCASDIDIIVTVSSTGVATPTLDARLMDIIGFRPDIMRLPLFGLGCAGGVMGLNRAHSMAKAHPGAKVLLLVLETCGLTFQRQDRSKSNIVATALFGDGAAGAVLCTDPLGSGDTGPMVTLEHIGEHRWPRSLGVMGWSVDNDGLGVIFSQSIPVLIRRDMGIVIDQFLNRHGLYKADIAGFVPHPGGSKVIDALAAVWGRDHDDLRHSREVLRKHGNMSAPTVLFALSKAIEDGLKGRVLTAAMGPGFSAALSTLRISP